MGKTENWIEKFLDEFKRLARRTESTEKTVNMIYQGQDLQEKTATRQLAIEDRLKMLEDRVASLEKHSRAGMQDVKNTVEDKIDELKETMDNIEKGGKK